ncbi:MAG: hypothetical protein NPIRA02_13460 [Nitrospirales bacterium]|nr:MAG: hypothetical protein NPIRA02_13460 [Nitrospirales bacterium]
MRKRERSPSTIETCPVDSSVSPWGYVSDVGPRKVGGWLIRLFNVIKSLAQISQIITETTQGFREETQGSLTAVQRHTGVLVEDLHHKLDLIVEGQQFIRQQVQGVHSELERESQETPSLLQLSYKQLHQKVQHLEQRVQAIEPHLGLSV